MYEYSIEFLKKGKHFLLNYEIYFRDNCNEYVATMVIPFRYGKLFLSDTGIFLRDPRLTKRIYPKGEVPKAVGSVAIFTHGLDSSYETWGKPVDRLGKVYVACLYHTDRTSGQLVSKTTDT